jgi:hypothetical protein
MGEADERTNVIDIRERLLEAKAKKYATRFAKDERELTKQDILIVLSCDPLASARMISESLWEDFNEAGDFLVRMILKEMREEGLLSYEPGKGWHLDAPAQQAFDNIFNVEVADE